MSRNTKYLHEELDKPNEHDKQIARQARQDALREAAEIARKHGEDIGERCWNHENAKFDEPQQGAESTCWEEIAAAIEARAKETE